MHMIGKVCGFGFGVFFEVRVYVHRELRSSKASPPPFLHISVVIVCAACSLLCGMEWWSGGGCRRRGEERIGFFMSVGS